MLQITLIIFNIIETISSPINTRQLDSDFRHFYPDIHLERTRIARAVTDPFFDDQDPIIDSKDDEEFLNTAPQTYYYYPYYRIRKISRRTYDNPSIQPLSNYADSYDRFPTVA